MIKKSIKRVVDKLGYSINKKPEINQTKESVSKSNPFIGFDYAEEGFKAVQLSKEFSMLAPINLFTLYEQAVYCEKKNIEGSFVECGVWKGGAIGIMAKANLDFGKTRREIHLFDAFDDICPPDAKIDGEKAVKDAKEIMGLENEKEMKGQLDSVKGAYDKLGGHGTIEICNKLLVDIIKYPVTKINYHKGWFQDTIPITKNTITDIAILRLDGDWYDSIKICLENLYDKVTKGGLVVIDDYGYYEGCTKAVDDFLERRGVKTFLSYSRVGCRYFVKS
ncbi:MAG: TylF/MycF/NovP-related O-methyltransferase [Ginsengibacter sp.]